MDKSMAGNIVSDIDDGESCVQSLLRGMENAIVDSDVHDIGRLKDALSQMDSISSEESKLINDLLIATEDICEGKYIKVLQLHWMQAQSITSSVDFVRNVIDSAHNFIRRSSFPLLTSYQIFFQGIALLNVFTRINYTGPALSIHELEALAAFSNAFIESEARDTLNYRSFACVALQVEGEYPYNVCEKLEILLLARCLLQTIGNWTKISWSGPIEGHENVFQVTKQITSASWWNARASLAHQRILLAKSACETLWNEVNAGFSAYKDAQDISQGHYSIHKHRAARLHIEWGLAHHFFDKGNRGKENFAKAQNLTGLTAELSGAIGKKTKYQQKGVAQMVLLASSNQKLHSTQSNSETELDQTAVVTLDEADPENILLEQIQFEDDTKPKQENLLVIDQIILLALCLDVKNNNPNDNLTREEMMAYIARVLEQPNNWMVYATALLERAWLECQTSKRRERAVLQIQALVDQHTNRLLTPTSLEDMTPAFERMAYVYALAFPPQFALKKDLAEQYFALGAVASALALYKELEIWDEVVLCYRLLDQQKKAEVLVRERISIEPTPYLWCCLGDLTGEIAHFEAAWDLSEHRYPRAKRSLGRAAFEANDIPSAIKHYEESLVINPMHTQTWFLLGVLGMRTSNWNLGLNSFTRVVQLDPDNAEAWGNIGSIHMTRKHFAEAFSVFQEAVKQKRFMWQIWENLAWCAVEIGKYGDAMYAQHQLLDLRSKHNRPVDHELLAWMVDAIVYKQEGVLQAHYKDELAKLLGRITSIVTNDPKLWQVYAYYNDGVGKQEKALDCRLKVSRTLQTANWEKDQDQVERVCHAALQVAAGYQVQDTKQALHAARLFVRGVLRRAQINFPHLELCEQLEKALQDIRTATDAMS